MDLFCIGSGLPEPKITWLIVIKLFFKIARRCFVLLQSDFTTIQEVENSTWHEILNSIHDKRGTSSISLTNVTVGGLYSCKFTNRIGNDSFTFNVTMTDPLPATSSNERGKMTAIFVVLGLIIVLLCCVLRLFYVRLKKVLIITEETTFFYVNFNI